jgi:hypothetical protein
MMFAGIALARTFQSTGFPASLATAIDRCDCLQAAVPHLVTAVRAAAENMASRVATT